MGERHPSFEDAQDQIRAFMAERAWSGFHTPKNLAMALAGEAAEILEIYQWMTPDESRDSRSDAEIKQAVADEIADVAVYLTVLADSMDVHIPSAIISKMARNEARFPPDSKLR